MSRYVSRAGTGLDAFQNDLARFVSLDDRGQSNQATSRQRLASQDQHSLATEAQSTRKRPRRRTRKRSFGLHTRLHTPQWTAEQLHAPHPLLPTRTSPNALTPEVTLSTPGVGRRRGLNRQRFYSVDTRPTAEPGETTSLLDGDAATDQHPLQHYHTVQGSFIPSVHYAEAPVHPTVIPIPPSVVTSPTHQGELPQVPPETPTVSGNKLGTFDGVFLPVCSSIWGIILFVRIGYSVGQAGVLGTVAIFILSYFITLMTSLSISAISTNGVVKGGGPYYMIARCLGPEFGGSIGAVFAVGTLLSGALNAIAFAEPLVANFGYQQGDLARWLPEGYWYSLLYNSVSLACCIGICLLGVKLFAKANTVLTGMVFTATLSTLVSFMFQSPFELPEKHVYFTGFSWHTLQENFWPEFSAVSPGNHETQSYHSIFSLIFPACIGMMAGVSMSGDLRKPGKSIPRGTLAGMALTITVYLLVVVGLGCTTSRHSLLHNYNILQEISVVPKVIAVGSLSTAFTSTLTCLIVSSKILQAIARDYIVPGFHIFRHGAIKTDEPYVAILVNYVVCQSALLAGDINVVAPFVTMFHLLTFATINLACFLLKISAAPNFRPRFRFFKWWTAFLGLIVSLCMIIVVNPLAGSLSLFIMYILFILIHYTTPPKAWGDVTQSLIYHQVRKYLLRLDTRKEHVKFWRPQILLLVHNPRRSYRLIKFCNSLKKGGLLVLGHILKGDFQSHLPELCRQQYAWLRFIDVTQIKAFVDLMISSTERVGVRNLVLGSGLGGMRPNIVVMGFYNLGSYRYRLRYQQEQDDDGGVSDDSYDSALEAMDLPTDHIELETSMSVQDYLCIIEDMLMIKKAVALAYGFSRLHRTCPPPNPVDRSWWESFCQCIHHGGESTSPKKFIDLWPIQMSLEHPYVTADTANPSELGGTGTLRTYTTNFDSYAMVLQLGTILHMAPYWRSHLTLRVMCFVEHAEDVAEERERVAQLLDTLRINAELHVFYLASGQVATYDLIVQGDASHMEVETHAINQLYQALDQGTDRNIHNELVPALLESGRRMGTTNHPTLTPTKDSQPRVVFDLPDSTMENPVTLQPLSAATPTTEGEVSVVNDPAMGTSGLQITEEQAQRDMSPRVTVAKIQRQAGPSRLSSSMKVTMAYPFASGPLLSSESESSLTSSESSEDMTSSGQWSSASSVRDGQEPGIPTCVPTTTLDQSQNALVSDPAASSKSCQNESSPTSNDIPRDGGNVHIDVASTTMSENGKIPETTGKRLEFNNLSNRAQNIIINNLIQLHSTNTAVIFTTLPTPDKGTHFSEEKSVHYIEDIELLVNGLPPTLLVHAASLT
ncbi:hypothetical protein IWQ61_006240, partial [Dispira simplex]